MLKALRWPSALDAGLGALCLVIVAFALWSFDPFGRRKHAEAVAAAATTQSHADTRATQALDHYTHETLIIREKANEAVERAQATPAASNALDPAVRAELCGYELCSDPQGAGDQRPAGVP